MLLLDCKLWASTGMPAAFDAAKVLVMPLLLNCSRKFLALETSRRDMTGYVAVVVV